MLNATDNASVHNLNENVQKLDKFVASNQKLNALIFAGTPNEKLIGISNEEDLIENFNFNLHRSSAWTHFVFQFSISRVDRSKEMMDEWKWISKSIEEITVQYDLFISLLGSNNPKLKDNNNKCALAGFILSNMLSAVPSFVAHDHYEL